jgi:hypothetical protein
LFSLFFREQRLHKRENAVELSGASQSQLTIDSDEWIGQVMLLDILQEICELSLGLALGQVNILYLNRRPVS